MCIYIYYNIILIYNKFITLYTELTDFVKMINFTRNLQQSFHSEDERFRGSLMLYLLQHGL